MKARTAPATTSWTLVGPKWGKYYLVGPRSQRTASEIVSLVCWRFVCLNLAGHHFSIQEVDREMFKLARLCFLADHEMLKLARLCFLAVHEMFKLARLCFLADHEMFKLARLCFLAVNTLD